MLPGMRSKICVIYSSNIPNSVQYNVSGRFVVLDLRFCIAAHSHCFVAVVLVECTYTNTVRDSILETLI